MVGTNGTPEFEVTIGNNIQKIMEEHGDFIWLMFFIGIISIIFYQIYDFIRFRKAQKNFNFENQTPNIQTSTTDDSKVYNNYVEETTIKANEEKGNKDMTFFVIIFFLVLFLIVAIVMSCAINNSTDNNFNEQTSQTRNATLDDIYTKITTISNDNRTITIQASEKIKGLVIEVRFIDKNAVVLKTQRIDVGNISPGNEFTYKLTLDGMKISDIDRVNSFTIRMVKGTIEE